MKLKNFYISELRLTIAVLMLVELALTFGPFMERARTGGSALLPVAYTVPLSASDDVLAVANPLIIGILLVGVVTCLSARAAAKVIRLLSAVGSFVYMMKWPALMSFLETLWETIGGGRYVYSHTTLGVVCAVLSAVVLFLTIISLREKRTPREKDAR